MATTAKGVAKAASSHGCTQNSSGNGYGNGSDKLTVSGGSVILNNTKYTRDSDLKKSTQWKK